MCLPYWFCCPQELLYNSFDLAVYFHVFPAQCEIRSEMISIAYYYREIDSQNGFNYKFLAAPKPNKKIVK